MKRRRIIVVLLILIIIGIGGAIYVTKSNQQAALERGLRSEKPERLANALKENKDVLEVLKDNQKTPLTTTFKVTIGSESGTSDLDGDVY